VDTTDTKILVIHLVDYLNFYIISEGSIAHFVLSANFILLHSKLIYACENKGGKKKRQNNMLH